MSIILQKEISDLKQQLLKLSSMVETSVENSIYSVENLDSALANKVIVQDDEIDSQEILIEEECLKVLALHQPVASDLRFIIAILKMNNDLERIGDLAVNIAKRTLLLKKHGEIDIKVDFSGIAQVVREMLKDCLDSLMDINSELAKRVCSKDDKVDELNREIYDQVKNEITSNPETVKNLLHILTISKNLERIADHATNIAEDVIYLSKGTIVRHEHN